MKSAAACRGRDFFLRPRHAKNDVERGDSALGRSSSWLTGVYWAVSMSFAGSPAAECFILRVVSVQSRSANVRTSGEMRPYSLPVYQFIRFRASEQTVIRTHARMRGFSKVVVGKHMSTSWEDLGSMAEAIVQEPKETLGSA